MMQSAQITYVRSELVQSVQHGITTLTHKATRYSRLQRSIAPAHATASILLQLLRALVYYSSHNLCLHDVTIAA
jgi:hypothetical protein